MRSLNSTLIQSLMETEPFRYAHLVKFEKPIKTESGKPTKSAISYSYITDASVDISFDDGSSSAIGTANGAQTYIANRLLDVSSISETIEARASNFSITIGAAALNTSLITSTYTTLVVSGSGPYTLTSNKNLVEAGFLEGDEIFLAGLGPGAVGWTGRINTFTTSGGVPNAIANLTLVEGTGGTGIPTSISINTKDIGAILLDKTKGSYARYINREVYVYKAHINVTTGAIIGDPFLLFKGIITSGSLTEDPTSDSKMVWNISSHWGDWVRVNGRLTSDSSHRALSNDGTSDRSALIRPEYADDLGFLHSEQALNIMASYKISETRYKMKKSGLFGLKVKMKEYQVQVDREVDLRFNLEAKYLPVVYGVQRLDSIPFFVDTDKTAPNKVYAAYALCEGEIGGIFDIYFGDQSSICLDADDSSVRSGSSTANIDVICSGRADRGDVLSAQTVTDTSTTFYADILRFNTGQLTLGTNLYAANFDRRFFDRNTAFSGSVAATATPLGITHEKGRSFTDPIDSKFVVHTGKEEQRADDILVKKAQNNEFKVQGAYYTGDKSQYWGANHRVLDTAYVTAEYILSEGEEELPSVEFIVKGKAIECYNYDYSYIHDPTKTTETTLPTIGATVTLSGVTNTSAVIADVYTDEFGQTRVRLLTDPGVISSSFTISSIVPAYTLLVSNSVLLTGTVPSILQSAVVSSTFSPTAQTYNITTTAGGVGIFGGINLPEMRFTILDNLLSDTSTLTTEQKNQIRVRAGGSSIPSGTSTTAVNGITNNTNVAPAFVITKNGIKLGTTGTSSTNDAYNSFIIELIRTNTDGSIITQKRTITDYDGTNRVATVDRDWDAIYYPRGTETLPADTYKIYAPSDKRISNNPAIQLLDYITNIRYGRGLDIINDINLETFKSSARKCDTRSDITLILASGTVNIGDIYRYTSTTLKFRGTVSAINTVNGFTEVTFTDVIGKLGNKWQDWKSYAIGDFIWKDGTVYQVTAAGTFSAWPPTSGATQVSTSFNLVKVSGNAGSTTPLPISITSASFDGNPIVKKYISTSKSYISGYSLYDCDDVKYWRYVGWNEQNQRHVTRHQTNVIVNTSTPVFDNINMLLGHFNGMLRYNAGKYELDVEARHNSTSSINGYFPNIITEDDIIGAISVEDPGNKDTFNTISIDIPDPRNRFEERSVTYFNSTYLVEDNSVPKKGDMKATGITNYFNARLNAKQYLESSRYGLKINFTMPPKGVIITAGEIIEITNARLGFVSKPFRVTNLTVNKDCLVQISADEHTNNAYSISPSTGGAFTSSEPVKGTSLPPGPVTNLTASVGITGGILLSWTNPIGFNSATDSVEIFKASQSSWTGTPSPSSLAVVKSATSYMDSIFSNDTTIYYYWLSVLRDAYKKATNSSIILRSIYTPTIGSPGIPGTTLSSLSTQYYIKLSAPVIFKDSSGAAVSGAHTEVTANGIKNNGGVEVPIGYLTVTPNGGAESALSPNTTVIAPGNTDGKTSYTVKLYSTNSTSPDKLLDSESIPVVFKGGDSITLDYTNDNHTATVIPGSNPDWTGSGGIVNVYEGGSILTFNANSVGYPTVAGSYNAIITVLTAGSGNSLSIPGITGGVVAPWAGTLTTVATYNLTAYIKTLNGLLITRSVTITLAPGTQAISSATANLYQRTTLNVVPTTQSNSLTYTFSTGAISGTINNNWLTTIPTSGTTSPYLWVSSAPVSGISPTVIIPPGQWTTGRLISQSGADGFSGTSVAQVYAYKRVNTAPTDNPGNVVYTFSTASVSTLSNNWSKVIPSGSSPLYVTVASAASPAAQDEIASTEWSSPVLLSGTDGLNVATVLIYKRTTTSSPPLVGSTPTSSIYTFQGGNLSTPPSGWSPSIPSSGGGYLWATQATAASISPTDTLGIGEWESPVRLVSQSGADGFSGTSVAQVYAYKRVNTAPTDNPGNVVYTFSTASVSTLSNGWSSTIPSGTSPIYVTVASAASPAAQDDIASSEWSSPVLISGTDGLNVATVLIYKRTTTNSTPSVGSTPTSAIYTFQTGGLSTPPSGWSPSIPDASGGGYLWATQATAASNSSTDTLAIGEWASPARLVSQTGVDGAPGSPGASGIDAITINMTKAAFSVTAYADGNVPSFTNADGYLTVYSGATDVTASATISPAVGINCTGTINTATGTPVTGSPKGYYRVTALTADSGILNFNVTYLGLTYPKTFTVSKNRIGYEIATSPGAVTGTLFEGRMVYATVDGKLYRYKGGQWTAEVSGGDITAATLEATAFSNNIQPITMVNSVPAPRTTDTIFNKADGKLYRWVSPSGYTAAISGVDITPYSLTKDAFASDIQPVTYETSPSLPTVFKTNSLFWTGTNKLYRWNGSAYVLQADTSDLIGQIVSNQISDNAITGSKLAIGDFSVLNTNPYFEDGDTGWNTGTIWTITTGNSKSGTYAAQSTAQGIATGLYSDSKVPTSEGETFYGQAYFKHSGATGSGSFIRIFSYSPGGVISGSNGNIITAATTAYSLSSISHTVPANATYVQLQAVSNITTGTSYLDEARLFRTSNTTLIADGAITTTKMTVGSINADRLTAGTISAGLIAANAITASKLAIGDYSNLMPDATMVEGSPSWTSFASPNAASSVTGAYSFISSNNSGLNFRSQKHISITSTSADYGAFIYSEWVPVEQGNKYYVSVQAKCQTGTGSPYGAYMYVQWTTDPTAGTYINGNNYFHNTSTVTEIGGQVSPPSGYRYGRVRLHKGINGTTTDVRFGGAMWRRANGGELIVDGAISANKIAAGSITADKIVSGEVTTTKLSVLVRDLVNPISMSGTLNGWGGIDELGVGSPATLVQTYNAAQKAIEITATATSPNSWTRSDSFPIDHNKIYKVNVSYRNTSAISPGTIYMGLSGYAAFTAGDQNVGPGSGQGFQNITGYTTSRGAVAAIADFYFTIAQTPTTTYNANTFYIIGANRNIQDCPNHVSTTATYPYAKLASTNTHVALRLLNWSNNTTTISQFKDISVTEIGTGQIVSDNITANAITAGKIAVGAVSAEQITSGAITTDKLLVTGRGKAINDDPMFMDTTAWYQAAGVGSYIYSNTLIPPFGTTGIIATGAVRLDSVNSYPVNAGVPYKVSVWVKRVGATSNPLYIRLYCTTGAGVLVNQTVTGLTPTTSTFENLTVPIVWTKYTGSISPGATATLAKPQIFLNWAGTTAGVMHVSDFRFEEYIDADLIVDGCISTNKIKALAITADKIEVGSITAAQIASNTITAAKMESQSITARELAISLTSPVGSGSGIHMDSGASGPKIDIYSAGVLRVRLGKLS